MSNTKAKLFTAFFVTFILGHAPANGEILLAEFELTQPEPITLPADYAFTVENIQLQQTVFWPAVVNQYPFTESASSEMASRFNAITTNSPHNHRELRMHNDFQPINQFNRVPFDQIWFDDVPDDGWRAQAFVPFVLPQTNDPRDRLHVGLWGYIVTGLERTITAESQLVRIYGHPIPEPATLSVLLVAVVHVFNRRSQRKQRLVDCRALLTPFPPVQ
jgi:hypothetical protein